MACTASRLQDIEGWHVDVSFLQPGAVSMSVLQLADVFTVRADRSLQLLSEAGAMMHKPWCDSSVPLAIIQPRPCNCRASGPGPIPIGASPFEVGGMTGAAYPVGATGPMGMIGMTRTADPSRSRDSWMPNRDPATEAGSGWQKFIERLGLSCWPETERTMLRGQDGWAFTAAVRFQHSACDLAESDESYYWSSYHLLALIIEKARSDFVFLEAIEALAVAHLYGGLSAADVTRQLKQIGVWP